MALIRLIVLQLVLLIGMGQAASQTNPPEKTESELFITKFKAYTDKNTHRLKPYDEKLSPWLPYLTQPFDEGLQGEQLDKFYFYQNNRLCKNTRDLEIVGFLNLHPQLTAAFQVQDIDVNFSVTIAYDLARGFLRCTELRWIDKMIFSPDEIESAGAEGHQTVADIIKNRQPRYDNPMHQLMKLAICADYAPAIADMLRFDGAHSDVLKPPERAYLQTRAFHKKIPLFGSLETVYVARNSVPGNLRLELDAVGYMADPRKIVNLLPSWNVWCAKTEFWRFKENFVNILMGTKDNR